MYRQVIEKAAEKMKKTTSVYQEDLRSIRAGRANPQFLERVTVDYYGVQTPLTQMGNITSPEPRMLVINVWDQKAIPMVEKAILKSDLGLNPTNDGKIIRLVVPELNEERRKELTKLVRKGAEESKVAIRSIRRDAMEGRKENAGNHRRRHQGHRRTVRQEGKGNHGGLTGFAAEPGWDRAVRRGSLFLLLWQSSAHLDSPFYSIVQYKEHCKLRRRVRRLILEGCGCSRPLSTCWGFRPSRRWPF